MAAAITKVSESRETTFVRAFGNLGTYAAGGVAVTPADFGLARIDAVIALSRTTVDRVYGYDKANGKITATVASTGVEVGAIDLSGTTVDFLVFGVK